MANAGKVGAGVEPWVLKHCEGTEGNAWKACIKEGTKEESKLGYSIFCDRPKDAAKANLYDQDPETYCLNKGNAAPKKSNAFTEEVLQESFKRQRSFPPAEY